jgi:methionine-gamma-lyase
MSPFTAWLLLRGLKTLPIRMDRHAANAERLAKFLESHSKVSRVWYPGLSSHPQHVVAPKQMSGFGGVVAFELEGGKSDGREFMNGLDLIRIAVSLGDCDSLVEQPSVMSHRSYSAEQLESLGIPEGLIRLSVGLEHVDDLIADLEKGLRET